jgi:membrane-associated protein
MFTLFQKLPDFMRMDLLVPLLLIVGYIILVFFARGILPSSDELITIFSKLYASYGYQILFISALMEALILVNLFVPGQVAMALGIVFARSGETELGLVVFVVALGSILGYTIDFLLGYFGFSSVIKKIGYGHVVVQADKQFAKLGTKGFILGFVQSNIASILSFVAGTSGMSWRVFMTITILATFFWVGIWSLIIYALGDVVLLIIRKYMFLVILIFLSGIFLSRLASKEK